MATIGNLTASFGLPGPVPLNRWEAAVAEVAKKNPQSRACGALTNVGAGECVTRRYRILGSPWDTIVPIGEDERMGCGSFRGFPVNGSMGMPLGDTFRDLASAAALGAPAGTGSMSAKQVSLRNGVNAEVREMSVPPTATSTESGLLLSGYADGHLTAYLSSTSEAAWAAKGLPNAGPRVPECRLSVSTPGPLSPPRHSVERMNDYVTFSLWKAVPTAPLDPLRAVHGFVLRDWAPCARASRTHDGGGHRVHPATPAFLHSDHGSCGSGAPIATYECCVRIALVHEVSGAVVVADVILHESYLPVVCDSAVGDHAGFSVAAAAAGQHGSHRDLGMEEPAVTPLGPVAPSQGRQRGEATAAADVAPRDHITAARAPRGNHFSYYDSTTCKAACSLLSVDGDTGAEHLRSTTGELMSNFHVVSSVDVVSQVMKASQHLGPATRRASSVQLSPDGRFLAVGFNEDTEVRVFAVAETLEYTPVSNTTSEALAAAKRVADHGHGLPSALSVIADCMPSPQTLLPPLGGTAGGPLPSSNISRGGPSRASAAPAASGARNPLPTSQRSKVGSARVGLGPVAGVELPGAPVYRCSCAFVLRCGETPGGVGTMPVSSRSTCVALVIAWIGLSVYTVCPLRRPCVNCTEGRPISANAAAATGRGRAAVGVKGRTVSSDASQHQSATASSPNALRLNFDDVVGAGAADEAVGHGLLGGSDASHAAGGARMISMWESGVCLDPLAVGLKTPPATSERIFPPGVQYHVLHVVITCCAPRAPDYHCVAIGCDSGHLYIHDGSSIVFFSNAASSEGNLVACSTSSAAVANLQYMVTSIFFQPPPPSSVRLSERTTPAPFTVLEDSSTDEKRPGDALGHLIVTMHSYQENHAMARVSVLQYSTACQHQAAYATLNLSRSGGGNIWATQPGPQMVTQLTNLSGVLFAFPIACLPLMAIQFDDGNALIWDCAFSTFIARLEGMDVSAVLGMAPNQSAPLQPRQRVTKGRRSFAVGVEGPSQSLSRSEAVTQREFRGRSASRVNAVQPTNVLAPLVDVRSHMALRPAPTESAAMLTFGTNLALVRTKFESHLRFVDRMKRVHSDTRVLVWWRLPLRGFTDGTAAMASTMGSAVRTQRSGTVASIVAPPPAAIRGSSPSFTGELSGTVIQAMSYEEGLLPRLFPVLYASFPGLSVGALHYLLQNLPPSSRGSPSQVRRIMLPPCGQLSATTYHTSDGSRGQFTPQGTPRGVSADDLAKALIEQTWQQAEERKTQLAAVLATIGSTAG